METPFGYSESTVNKVGEEGAPEGARTPEVLKLRLAEPPERIIDDQKLKRTERGEEPCEESGMSAERARYERTERLIKVRQLLNRPQLFLPDRMILGKCSEFLVKGPPGMNVAVAMADRNQGAKPIFGHALRLGADRKVVAIGTIPESGVLPLSIETPIQGDLIGQPLFFEAALWSTPDFSDLKMASAVACEKGSEFDNGVIVSPEIEPKKGSLFVLDTPKPPSMKAPSGSLSTGTP